MKKLLKSILLIINVVVACALLLSGYGGHFDPSFSALPGCALMIFPAVAAASLLLLLIDLITCRKLAYWQAFAILFCAPAIWSFCPMNISTPKMPDGDRELKVMSYNVLHFNSYASGQFSDSIAPLTLRTIIDADPDIVCIQETRLNDPTVWRYLPEQVDTIVKRYPYRTIGSRALSLWSKHPFDTLALKQPDDPTGMLMGARINVDGTPVTLYNVHLQSVGLSKDDKELYGSITRKPTTHKLEDARYGLLSKFASAMRERSKQAEELRCIIDSIGGSNIIVAGDFNDIEGCHAMRVIEGKTLHSTFSSAGFGPTITYFANRFYFNIDHILYGGDTKALDFKCYKVRSSDHYAIMGTFAIPEATDKANSEPESNNTTEE